MASRSRKAIADSSRSRQKKRSSSVIVVHHRSVICEWSEKKSAAERSLIRPDHPHDGAGLGVDVGDVGSIDPRVAAAQAGFAFRGDRDDGGHRHRLSLDLMIG